MIGRRRSGRRLRDGSHAARPNSRLTEPAPPRAHSISPRRGTRPRHRRIPVSASIRPWPDHQARKSAPLPQRRFCAFAPRCRQRHSSCADDRSAVVTHPPSVAADPGHPQFNRPRHRTSGSSSPPARDQDTQIRTLHLTEMSVWTSYPFRPLERHRLPTPCPLHTRNRTRRRIPRRPPHTGTESGHRPPGPGSRT